MKRSVPMRCEATQEQVHDMVKVAVRTATEARAGTPVCPLPGEAAKYYTINVGELDRVEIDTSEFFWTRDCDFIVIEDVVFSNPDEGDGACEIASFGIVFRTTYGPPVEHWFRTPYEARQFAMIMKSDYEFGVSSWTFLCKFVHGAPQAEVSLRVRCYHCAVEADMCQACTLMLLDYKPPSRRGVFQEAVAGTPEYIDVRNAELHHLLVPLT